MQPLFVKEPKLLLLGLEEACPCTLQERFQELASYQPRDLALYERAILSTWNGVRVQEVRQELLT